MRKILIFLTLVLFLISCGGKKEDQALKPPTTNEEAIQIYQEALDGLTRGDYLYASRKFSEAEGMLSEIDWAAKSALMSSYCLYNINSYDEAILNLRRFLSNCQVNYLKMIICGMLFLRNVKLGLNLGIFTLIKSGMN